MIEIDWGGERLTVLADRALLLAAAARRCSSPIRISARRPRSGRPAFPIPHGTTATDLGSPARAVGRHAAPSGWSCWAIFFTPAAAGRKSTLAAIAAWRAEHRQLEILLVRGNHDEHAGDPPDGVANQLLGRAAARRAVLAGPSSAAAAGRFCAGRPFASGPVARRWLRRLAAQRLFLVPEAGGGAAGLRAFHRRSQACGPRAGDRVFVVGPASRWSRFRRAFSTRPAADMPRRVPAWWSDYMPGSDMAGRPAQLCAGHDFGFCSRSHAMEDPQDLVSVYQAANTTEAYFVRNLLVDAGIAAEVSEENEPLAGSAGRPARRAGETGRRGAGAEDRRRVRKRAGRAGRASRLGLSRSAGPR